MTAIIRQSTAITVAVGPFLDEDDGKTAETGLTITQSDIRLSKNGGSFAQKSASGTASHMENGYYSVSLSTTDTNTVGRLTLHVHKSGALPVFHEFQVVEEAVYDALFASGATGALPVSGNVTVGSIGSGVITASSIASNAITSAKIATNAIGSSQLATDAIGSAQLATTAVNEITAAVLSVLKGQDTRGTAQAGGASTITLASGASSVNNFYNGALIVILEGTGSDVPVARRTRQITDYVGSTRVATVDSPWEIQPDNTTVYLIVGG